MAAGRAAKREGVVAACGEGEPSAKVTEVGCARREQHRGLARPCLVCVWPQRWPAERRRMGLAVRVTAPVATPPTIQRLSRRSPARSLQSPPGCPGTAVVDGGERQGPRARSQGSRERPEVARVAWALGWLPADAGKRRLGLRVCRAARASAAVDRGFGALTSAGVSPHSSSMSEPPPHTMASLLRAYQDDVIRLEAC